METGWRPEDTAPALVEESGAARPPREATTGTGRKERGRRITPPAHTGEVEATREVEATATTQTAGTRTTKAAATAGLTSKRYMEALTLPM